MLNLKGFVTIHSLVNNNNMQTSLLGELSPMAKTYSTSQKDYSHATLKDYTITSFLEDNNNGNGVELVAMSTAIDLVEAIKIYTTTNAGVIDNVLFNATITAAFNTRIALFTFGPWVTVGATRLPEWIAYDALDVIPAQPAAAHVKLWISDPAFIGQYDSYEIRYASAISSNPFDLFNNNIGAAQALANANTPDVIMAKLDTVKAAIPESKTTLYRFDYVPANPAIAPIPFWFAVANYSLYGDTLDAVKLAITTNLLRGSEYMRADWELIFPSLFKTSEFYIMPRWDRYAIPNLTVQAGMYSPVVSPNDAIAYATRHLPANYTPADIAANLAVFNTVYKELTIEAIGDPTNLGGKSRFDMVFPDYLSISTVSPDFSRMSLTTQNFILLLERMLIAAETVTTINNVPTDMRKVVRNGQLYVSVTYNLMQYLVSAKSNNWV